MTEYRLRERYSKAKLIMCPWSLNGGIEETNIEWRVDGKWYRKGSVRFDELEQEYQDNRNNKL